MPHHQDTQINRNYAYPAFFLSMTLRLLHTSFSILSCFCSRNKISIDMIISIFRIKEKGRTRVSKATNYPTKKPERKKIESLLLTHIQLLMWNFFILYIPRKCNCLFVMNIFVSWSDSLLTRTQWIFHWPVIKSIRNETIDIHTHTHKVCCNCFYFIDKLRSFRLDLWCSNALAFFIHYTFVVFKECVR